jgi:UDP-N-acetylglucosamine:LPS N-acetylglucosamine transferase
MPGILILTAHSGGGHDSHAQALRERLPASAPSAIVDPLPSTTHRHYRFVSRHALGLWAAEFHSTNSPARARALHWLLDILLGQRLTALLDDYQPALVLSTSALLTEVARRASARLRRPALFAMLFADANRLHASWLTARSSAATLAPTRETYQEALNAGFVPAHLHLTGWPVRSQFYQASSYDRAAVLAQLQLDPGRFTAFIQGGGEGTANILRTVQSGLAAGTAQVILAAGTNRALQEQFSGVPGVRTIGFTHQIAPIMAAADVVLGKAGPNMLFESVMLGKPFIATTYIPGQEAGNLELLDRYGLGWVALKVREQRALLAALAEAPGKLAAMAESVQRYRAWNSVAAEAIGPLLRDLYCAAVPAHEFQQQPIGQPANAGMGSNR